MLEAKVDERRNGFIGWMTESLGHESARLLWTSLSLIVQPAKEILLRKN